MQITLNQDEIEEAIDAYVRGQITIGSNQQISIDLRAGRGDNGFSATLEIKARKAATPTPVKRSADVEPIQARPRAVEVAPVVTAPEAAADISETVEEHVEEVAADAVEAAEAPEEVVAEAPRKGSIFNFKG
jgi:hypothetical protein